MIINNSVIYAGVNDKEIDLFEGQYPVPNGMAYNSYIILDEKIAVMDSVDARFGKQWIDNISKSLNGKSPDYLIVQHMEPDHSANIDLFMHTFPTATVVASERAFVIMKQFFGTDYPDRKLVVKEGDKLVLGAHTLSFIEAPMVHWPEVIMTYDEKDKILFSADAFGKFGALDTDEDWACEARRYYFGIVGKYGVQVQKVLAKAKALEINTICPLHGPILTENLGYYIDLYNTWSSYQTESDGVAIFYTSVYGNTKRAVLKLENKLNELGVKKCVITDLARCDMFEAVEDAFRYGKIVLATTTYNGDMFPFMKTFIDALLERNYQNKIIGIIENVSWAPIVANKIKGAFEKSKNIKILDNVVTIRSALNSDNIEKISALANELL